MASERTERAVPSARARTRRRESELRWLGSREWAWIREIGQHFLAHPPGGDDRGFPSRGFPIDPPPVTMPECHRGPSPAGGLGT
jgi:hypothetical protein